MDKRVEKLATRQSSLPERQGDRGLTALIYNATQQNDMHQAHAIMREYIKRYGDRFPVSPVPELKELVIAAAFDVYRVLTNPMQNYDEIDSVPEWATICTDHFLKDPFRKDYLKSLDSLLEQRTTKSNVEAAIKVSEIIGATDSYRKRFIDSSISILFEESYYVASILHEMDADENDIFHATNLAKVRLRSGHIALYKSAVGALMALWGDLYGEEEYVREAYHKEFGRAIQPFVPLAEMRVMGITPDRERLVRMAQQSLVDSKEPYAAARMARALLVMGYEINRDMKNLVRMAVRSDHNDYAASVNRKIPKFSGKRLKIERIKKRIRASLQEMPSE